MIMKGIAVFLFSFILFSCRYSGVGKVEFNVINETDSIIDVIHIQNSSGNRVKLIKIKPYSVKTVYLRKSFKHSSVGGGHFYSAKKGNKEIKMKRIGSHYIRGERKGEKFFIVIKNDNTIEVFENQIVLMSKNAWRVN